MSQLKKFNSVAGFSVGEPGNIIDVVDNVANVYANRLFVTQYSNLGDIANVYIGGGSSGYVLKTDGTGNLSWGQDTAPAGGNTTEIQFNTGGSLDGSSAFTFDKVSNTLTITGNISTSNANLGNLAIANYLTGTLTTQEQPNVTSVGTLSNVTVTGNITSGNATLGNLVTANYFSGNGSLLTSLTGGNVTGQVGNALVAGTVYGNVQSNITSVGTLSSVTISGLTTATGGIKTGNIQDSTGTNTISVSSTTVGIIGDLTVGTGGTGNATATYFIGNGSTLTSINAANVTGQVSNALVAGTVYTAAQPNITSVGTLTTANVSGNITSGNATLGNLVTANYFSGDGSGLTNIPAGSIISNGTSNVTVASANSNITFGVNGTSNVVVVGNTLVTITGNLSVTGSFSKDSKNVTTYVSSTTTPTNPTVGDQWYDQTNDITYQYIYDGVSYYWVDISSGYIDSNVNAVANTLVLRDANANIYGNYIVGSGLSINGPANLGAVGNVTITGGTANYVLQTNGSGGLSWVSPGSFSTSAAGSNTQIQFNDDGSFGADANFTYNKGTDTLGVKYISIESTGNITGGNLVSANFFTGTLTTAAQPNITSVGTLVDANITGNLLIGGNLIVNGTTEYTNVTNLYVKDPIIEMGGGANNTPLTTNDGKDRGTLLHYYTTKVVDAFMGWDNSNGEFAFGSNVSVSSEVVTFNNFGNLRAGYFIGNGSLLTSITGGNITGQVGNALVAGTVYSNAQPNITSVGTLASINVTGNVSSGGNIIGNGQYLTSITGGNVTGQVANALVAGTVYTAAQPNITSVGTLTSLTVSGNVSANYFIGDGSQLTGLPASYSNANVAAYLPTYTGNFTAGNVSVTGNVSSAYFIGDGSALTNINGSNVTGQVGNALVAGTVYSNAQPNITSVGTLTSLDVSGNANINGTLFANSIVGPSTANVTITANTFVSTFDEFGNITLSNNVNVVANLTVNQNVNFTNTSNVALGDIGNVHILGGSSGYVLKTDGSGNLSWGSDSTNPAGSNTQVQFNDGGSSLGASAAFTFDKGTNALSITGNITSQNATLGNLVTANYFSGDGSLLTSLTGSNVTGQVANALIAGTVYSNAQPNITSVGTLTSLDVSGNVTSAYFIGDGSQLTGLPASYSNANVAAYLPTYTGNFTAGNVSTTGNITAAYFIGDGSQLTGLPASYANANVEAFLPTYTGNISAGNVFVNNLGFGQIAISGTSSQLVGGPDLLWEFSNAALWTTRIKSNGYITTTGNVTSGNATLGNLVTANYFAGTLTTQDQPNITSIGTLSGLTVNGLTDLGSVSNLTITGGTSGYVLTTDGSGNLTWGAAGSGAAGLVSISKDRFLTTGSANTFSLSTTPASKNLIEVVIDGLQQISNTYSLSGTTLSFPTNPAAGQIIEVTTFGAVDLTGNIGEVQYNAGGSFGSSNTFTFNTGTNTLSVANLVTSGNITTQSGYLYVDTGIIAVSSGNAGIFNTSISNINLGLVANVTMGSTSGNVTARGTFNSNNAVINTVGVKNYYSTNDAVIVTTDTIIDQFPVNTYRSAKYTMRVNSDDGYQAVEVLLVHNGASSYVTIYGSISSIGTDIVSLSSNIGSGNVRLYATTSSTNTNVKILGTYVPD